MATLGTHLMDGTLDRRQAQYLDLFESESDTPLRNACVLVVGAHASAGAAVTCLAKAGVGTLRLADGHDVTRDDLLTDPFTPVTSVGKPRVKALADGVLALNPSVTIDLVLTGVTEDNAGRLVEDATHILCEPASVSESSIRWLDDAAAAAELPVVVGSSADLVSSIATCTPGGPGLTAALEALTDSRAPSSSWSSVPVQIITGARMALEVLNLAAGRPALAVAPECSRIHLCNDMVRAPQAA